MPQISDLNIDSITHLTTPADLIASIPAEETLKEFVEQSRQTVKNILDKKKEDNRFVMVVGPCSIHDPEAAMDYAERLKSLADKVSDTIYIIMRVYFEKPRTTVGWKGLINDPDLNNQYDVEKGLRIARELLIKINSMGLPAGTEMLDPITPQYYSDLISWSAIGARTTESQTHRELASGLSMPVGFKNGTNGSLEVAINALQSSMNPHSFLGVKEDGKVSIVKTTGNKYGHVVLRGGDSGPNHHPEMVNKTEELLAKFTLRKAIMIDCSHANSNKDHKLQPAVLKEVIDQVANGNRSIIGAMLESNIKEGNQKLGDGTNLTYGVSVTDKCLGWEDTESSILQAYEHLKSSKR